MSRLGCAAVGPVFDVVRVAAAGVQPESDSGCRGPGGRDGCGRHRTRLAPDVEDRAVGAVAHLTTDASHARRRDVSAETSTAPWSTSSAPTDLACRHPLVSPAASRLGVDVQHHLVAVAGGPAVESASAPPRRAGRGRRPGAAPASPRPRRLGLRRRLGLAGTGGRLAASSARWTTAPTSGVRRPRITTMPSSSTQVESCVQMPRLGLRRCRHRDRRAARRARSARRGRRCRPGRNPAARPRCRAWRRG